MQTSVIIPCLNEDSNLQATVESLGFGSASPPAGAQLVLVDNGSDDGTLDVMWMIQSACPAGTVEVVQEPRRGYVAARGAGVEAAAAAAARSGIPEDQVLIVQADADTSYSETYVEALAREFRASGPGFLLEGRNERPDGPRDACSDFDDLSAEIDEATAGLFCDGAFDVVVDDKVVAYSLADYHAWGGHAREETASGHEILAETTRLFVKGRLKGARRRTVDAATAVTSRRRVLAEPALSFATAGFPRDDGWRARWTKAYAGPGDLGTFAPRWRVLVGEAVRTRVVHLVALFGVLPAAMASLCGATPDERYHAILNGLRLPTSEEALRRPGLVLEHVLSTTDGQVESLFRASGSPPPWSPA